MASNGTCHALPCNIDYTGKAPVDVYFRPTPTEDGKFQAAAFRGRGLLAANAVSLNSAVGPVEMSEVDAVETSEGETIERFQRTLVRGHLFETVNDGATKGGGRQLSSVAQFGTFIEWRHEHQVPALIQNEDCSCRLSNALDWIEIATALHAPLPVPEKK